MLFRQAIGVAAQDITINFTFRQSRNQQFKGKDTKIPILPQQMFAN